METITSHLPRRRARRFSRVERASHLASWKQSGQSAQVYADAHGLRAGNLYAWAAQVRTSAPSSSAFVPVRLSAPDPSVYETSTATITVRSGELEYAISGVSSSGELIGLVQLLKQEVIDV